MIINKVHIKKFRGFEEVEFELGNNITVISGQNGTQKTTMLGILSQPFSISDEDNPMINEKPLCGGNFKSDFSNKFKFSNLFDKSGEHEWTLFFKDETEPYTTESIDRDKEKGTLRFWKKGDRSKGSGYIQYPVIYLSLKRLLPIGEDEKLHSDNSIILTEDEFKFYKKWHNDILILTKELIIESNYLTSIHKQTLGATTDHYDWKLNSAGQDNIGKILLAILTFKRLKAKYPLFYKGGILAIDELDTTLYTGSQLKLLNALIRFSSEYNIQIIFTTHSLTLLEESCRLHEDKNRIDQIKVMYLKKLDKKITIKDNVSIEYIKNDLNVTLSGKTVEKIDAFTEDKETAAFVKALLKNKKSKLNFNDISLGCGNYIQLSEKKIPPFTFPNSIIFLDGDVRSGIKKEKQIKKLKNIVVLPSNKSPEQLISQFLFDLNETDVLWEAIGSNFTHQTCFKDYKNEEIQNSREKAKKWFNIHRVIWGLNATKVINPWIKANQKEVDKFITEFTNTFNNSAEKKGFKKL